MNLLKKIIYYNSPQNIIVRFKAFNTKQKWLFVDAIAMLIFALYFLTTELMFMLYLCIAFSVMSFIVIYLTKGE
tara:strand:- start:257 stop:478 length:222 start_codon:yes stop_codon:yes gene_type:complete